MNKFEVLKTLFLAAAEAGSVGRVGIRLLEVPS